MKEKWNRSKNNLIMGQDYEWDEQGLMVFSKAYLEGRGFCCSHACRNCPYPKSTKNEMD